MVSVKNKSSMRNKSQKKVSKYNTGQTKKSKGKVKKTQRRSKKIEVIIVERKLSDEYMKKKEGEYFGEKSYDRIVDSNCDVYYYEDGKKQTLLKFRKNVIP